MLRTAGSPTADGKADLEGQQKADQRPLLPGLVYPAARTRAVSRAARSPPDWKDPSTARHLPTAADASSDQSLRSWALALP